MFDFRKIEAFCSVYEQRSFSRAGEVLFLSQPTVSAHILALEKELGVKLFDRMGRVVLPTAAGEALYQHSRKAFAELAAAKDAICMLMGETAGEINLGSSTIPSAFILPEIITAFLGQCPKARINLTVKDSREIIRAVLDGDLHAGVVGAVEDEPDLAFHPLVKDELIIVAAPAFTDRLEQEGSRASFDEVAAWPWIMREEGSGTRKSFEAGLQKAGLNARSLNIVMRVDSTQAAVSYALAGLGLTVTSRLVVEELLERDRLREIRVDKLKLPRDFYLVLNARREVFAVLAGFTRHLLEQTAPRR